MSKNVYINNPTGSDRHVGELDPTFLPVGSTCREQLQDYQSPLAVRTAVDLPSRFYLGSIVPESF